MYVLLACPVSGALVPQKIPHIPEVEANNKHVGREYDSLAA